MAKEQKTKKETAIEGVTQIAEQPKVVVKDNTKKRYLGNKR